MDMSVGQTFLSVVYLNWTDESGKNVCPTDYRNFIQHLRLDATNRKKQWLRTAIFLISQKRLYY